MSVEIVPVGARERPVLERLVQLYLHDFGGDGGPEIEADGTFSYPELATYGRDSGCDAFLFREDDRPVGFALVTDASDGGRFVEDFFVVRANRRGGVGTQASRLLFATSKGRWQLSVRDSNPSALPFWRHALAGLGASEDHRTRDGIGRTVFTFET